MKRSLLILALGAALALPAWAQSDDDSSSSTPPPHHHGHGAGLTKAEWTELKTAHEDALKADPSLATDGKALREQFKAYMKKMHDGMVAADPDVKPILEKLEAGHHHHHGPPPSDSGSDDSNN
jgi:Spy/CpxP family protein refolding chaperone